MTATPKIKVATVRKPATKKLSTPAKKVTASGTRKSVSIATQKKQVALPVAKKAKPKKIKLVRDNFSMPESDFEKLAALKKRGAASRGALILKFWMHLSKDKQEARLKALEQSARIAA